MSSTIEYAPQVLEDSGTFPDTEARRLTDLADAMYWDSMSPVEGYFGKDKGNTSAIGSILMEHYMCPDSENGNFYTEAEVVKAWTNVEMRRNEGAQTARSMRSFVTSSPVRSNG